MKYTQIIALIAVICLALSFAHAYESYDFENDLETFDDVYHDETEDVFEFLDQIQTQQQFLATFDPSDYEADMLSMLNDILSYLSSLYCP